MIFLTFEIAGHTAGILAGLSYQRTYLSKYGPVKFSDSSENESEDNSEYS